MTVPLIITTSTDPFMRGLDYLYGVRRLALTPALVDIVYDLEARGPICTWIGQQIEAVNAQLQIYLNACHACFHPWEQPQVQVLAAPLAQSFGLAALCNLQTQPLTMLIDVGRVRPQDWWLLVVHEYAHAQVGSPGHHHQFARSLTHLCLGLDLQPPVYPPSAADQLRFYPPCPLTADPLAEWRGEGADWRSSVKNSYFSA